MRRPDIGPKGAYRPAAARYFPGKFNIITHNMPTKQLILGLLGPQIAVFKLK